MQTSYHSHKRFLILNLINHLGPISRTELITLTEYRPASVGAIIKELLDEGLIVESGYASGGPGRRRTLLEINHSHICAVGISISPDSASFMMAQSDGKVLEQLEMEIRTDDQQELCGLITAQVAEMKKRHEDYRILGVGICDPHKDPLRYQVGRTLLENYNHFDDWWYYELKPYMENALKLPVQVFSHITLPTIAEQSFGVAKGVRDFILVEMSNGIGMSPCCNGAPVGGSRNAAGELGHTVVDYGDPNPKMCYCGKQGCLESTTAFPAISEQITSALERGVSSALNGYYDRSRPLTVQDVRRALDENDQLCRFVVRRAAQKLGVAIANVVEVLNPEMVVLYGFMLELGDYFFTNLTNSLRENLLVVSSDIRICTSVSMESGHLLGATAEIFTSYLKIADYQWVYQMQPEDLRAHLEEETEEE